MLLLDTHLVLWFAFDSTKLSKKASSLLRDRDNAVSFSHATLWEVAIKSSLGRPDFSVDTRVLRQGLLDQGLRELAISPAHIERVASLPWVHRDPFDRLLVAQAQEDGLTLLTIDRALKGYGRFVRVV